MCWQLMPSLSSSGELAVHAMAAHISEISDTLVEVFVLDILLVKVTHAYEADSVTILRCSFRCRVLALLTNFANHLHWLVSCLQDR